ncbi:MAG: CoA ester lyase [Alphaproteobacteria bacterium]|nr:CoA ester lyase [Alphaproteobacteria bacterium]MBE8221026.1 CoA ester lyase [Alphaproteobacteria bacterium]
MAQATPSLKSPSTKAKRSALYVPGANVKALNKAACLAADCLIFDLEDAVAPAMKEVARDNVITALQENDYGTKEVVVRINADKQWAQDDIAALNNFVNALQGTTQLAGALVPKIDTTDLIIKTRQALAPALDLWMMIETTAAIINIAPLTKGAAQHKVACFVMGTNDLSKELRAHIVAGRHPLLPALSQVLMAARHYDMAVLDGVYNDIDNDEGFACEAQQGLEMGFDGKTLIHPRQIEPCNLAFTPSADEIAEAQLIIAAFAAPENAGAGVLRVNGKMVEILHRDNALRILALANETL